jgi:hypothetical protein
MVAYISRVSNIYLTAIVGGERDDDWKDDTSWLDGVHEG